MFAERFSAYDDDAPEAVEIRARLSGMAATVAEVRTRKSVVF
jgi:hypothetical protein